MTEEHAGEQNKRQLRCPACKAALIAVNGPFDDIETAVTVLKKIFQEKDRDRYPLDEIELSCPYCSEFVGPSALTEEQDNESQEFLTAHCAPCEADWIVTTEKISGKAAGVGGSAERTRLTCPHCGDSYIIR